MSDGPFHLICVFWGEAHRTLFLDVCLSALLAEGNLPALAAAGARAAEPKPHRLVLCTTPSDRRVVEQDARLQAAAGLVGLDFLDIGDPERFDNKYLAMSHGHRLATRIAHAEGACAVFLTPDMILSAGAIAHLVALRKGGAQVVLCAAIRFEERGVLDELEGCRRPDGAIQIAPKPLIDIALDNLHFEARKFLWNAPAFAQYPYNVIWPVSDGAVVHSFSWAPLLLDYRAVDGHDEATFDQWTLDGDYVSRNFGAALQQGTLRIVDDSRALALVSLAPADDVSFIPEADPTRRRLAMGLPVIGRIYRIVRLHAVVSGGRMDPLKIAIFSSAVNLYGERNRPDAPPRARILPFAAHIATSAVRPGFAIAFIAGLSQNGPAAALNFAVTSLWGRLPVSWRNAIRRLLLRRREEA